MRKTLAEIAGFLQGKVIGDGGIVITGISGVKEAAPGDLTFLANPKYIPLVKTSRASAVIVGPDVLVEGKTVIQTENPSLAFAKVAGSIKEDLRPRINGVHPSAFVAPDVVLGEDVGIGANAVVEAGASIGKGTVICAGAVIGRKTRIGERCLIYSNVTVREDVAIGNDVIIHSGTVIGSDGFGYVTVEDKHEKIPQTGTVVIEDDVEIGACVTVDRARFDKTVIGRGTKIDNLVQIAHNVRIGENCILVAFAGVAGSSTIGNNVTIAGQAGVAGHITVGDRAIVAGQAGVTKDVPAGMIVSGYPAEEHRKSSRLMGHVQRLPHYVKEIRALKEKIAKIEERLRTQDAG